jgi:hypothetical protein
MWNKILPPMKLYMSNISIRGSMYLSTGSTVTKTINIGVVRG